MNVIEFQRESLLFYVFIHEYYFLANYKTYKNFNDIKMAIETG